MDGINQGSLPVFAPQGLFGGLLGSVVGGLGGGALGGLLGNRNLGQQIGNVAGSVLGGLLPFGVDPQQYLQAQQIAAQGLFMDGFAPQPIQSLIARGLATLGQAQQNTGIVPPQLGRVLPFWVDPQQYVQAQQLAALSQAQNAQFAPQGLFGNITGVHLPGFLALIQRPQLGSDSRGFGQGLLLRDLLPFGVDPQQYLQAQQLAPQGLIGNILGAPLSPIADGFGNQGLGQQIGGIAGQLGRLLPFGIDPQQYLQAQQIAPQWVDQPLSTYLDALRRLPGSVGERLPLGMVDWARLSPFGVDPQQYLQAQQIAALSQAQQNAYLAPQSGTIGSLLQGIGGPLGGKSPLSEWAEWARNEWMPIRYF